jgi:hypothetical protein
VNHEQFCREVWRGDPCHPPTDDLLLRLKGTEIAASTPVQVTVASLILGKAVLLADMLPFINRYPDKPLAYNIAWKTVIYGLVATLIHYLERLVEFWKQAGSVAAGNQRLLAEIVWPHFLATRAPEAEKPRQPGRRVASASEIHRSRAGRPEFRISVETA